MKTSNIRKSTQSGLGKNGKGTGKFTFYCRESHGTGFLLGFMTLLLIQVIFPSITQWLAGDIVTVLVIVLFILSLLGSYPYLKDGKSGGKLNKELQADTATNKEKPTLIL